MLISNKLALLATSSGLFRVGNGGNVQNAASSAAINWTQIIVPEGIGIVTNIFAVSKTGREQDVALMGGGQLYVVSADRGNNRSQVNRFVVADISATKIENETITPFPDIFTEGIISYFANFGEFRDLFVTDGVSNFHARAKELTQNANVKLLPAKLETRIQSGFRFLGVRSVTVPVSVQESEAIATMVQNSASGSWLIGNDLGVQVNE